MALVRCMTEMGMGWMSTASIPRWRPSAPSLMLCTTAVSDSPDWLAPPLTI